MIAGPVPKSAFCGNSLLVSELSGGTDAVSTALQAILNSFVFDYWIRQTVSANLNMFFIMQVPVPRIEEMHKQFESITHRAARLICTTPEFDDLAKSVGLKSHKDGATERARLPSSKPCRGR